MLLFASLQHDTMPKLLSTHLTSTFTTLQTAFSCLPQRHGQASGAAISRMDRAYGSIR